MIETYEMAKKEMERHIKAYKDHLEKHKPLLEIAAEYANMFSEDCEYVGESNRYSGVGFAFGTGTHNSTNLDLYMGKDDSLALDVMPIVNDIRGQGDFEEKVSWSGKDSPNWGYRYWTFKYLPTNAELYVRAWFERSTRCKKVGTGEFIEKMKVVCE